jgi:hypothetical protein
MDAEYDAAIINAVAAMAGAIKSGDASPMVAAMREVCRLRGGLTPDGKFYVKAIAAEVTAEVLDRFTAALAARLAPKMEAHSPEEALAMDEELARIRAEAAAVLAVFSGDA